MLKLKKVKELEQLLCEANRMIEHQRKLIARQQETLDWLEKTPIRECRDLYIDHALLVKVDWKHAFLKAVKDEAVKEFAVNLKRNTRQMTEYDEGGWGAPINVVDVDTINDILEEMTEDEYNG